MRRRRPLVAGVLLVAIALLAVAALRLSPLGPGPDLPAGATRLQLRTEAPHLLPTMGCELALLVPARVAASGDALILESAATGESIEVVWPSGWAAWRIDGRAQLVGRDGSIVARDGDVLSNLGGGVGADDRFHVCIIGG